MTSAPLPSHRSKRLKTSSASPSQRRSGPGCPAVAPRSGGKAGQPDAPRGGAGHPEPQDVAAAVELRRLGTALGRLRDRTRKRGSRPRPQASAPDPRFGEYAEALEQLSRRLRQFCGEFSDDRVRLNLITEEFRQNVISLTMLPLLTVFDAFPRAARDLARQFDKEVEVTITGRGDGARQEDHRADFGSADAPGAQRHRSRHRAAGRAAPQGQAGRRAALDLGGAAGQPHPDFRPRRRPGDRSRGAARRGDSPRARARRGSGAVDRTRSCSSSSSSPASARARRPRTSPGAASGWTS